MRKSHLEVFLVHPGGPFWASKDTGAWSIPKGEYADGEEPFEAAKREFCEETGFAPEGKFLELDLITQSVEGNCDPDRLTSNLCQIEWPPRSGRLVEFPEVD